MQRSVESCGCGSQRALNLRFVIGQRVAGICCGEQGIVIASLPSISIRLSVLVAVKYDCQMHYGAFIYRDTMDEFQDWTFQLHLHTEGNIRC